MTNGEAWYVSLPVAQRKRVLFLRWLHKQGRLEPPSIAAEREPSFRRGDPGDETPFDPASAGSA